MSKVRRSGAWIVLSVAGVASAALVSRRVETTRLEPAQGNEAYAMGYARPVATWGDWAFSGNPRTVDDEGEAYVFEHTTHGWVRRATLASDNRAPNFGYAFAAQDRTLAVTSCQPFEGDLETADGFAWVFTRSAAGTWTQQARLENPTETPQGFGRSIALDGDVAVVGGAPFPYQGGDGAAYVFARSNTTWTHEATLLPEAPGAGSTGFGWSCAVSGDTLIVGEPWGGDGAAHVYVRSGTTWTLEQKLTQPATLDDGATATFGLSVSIDGDTAAVGGQGAEGQVGAAWIYTRRRGVWTLQQRLGDDVELTPEGTLFGRDVVVRGERVIVGAAWATPEPTAFTYVRRGRTWRHEAELIEADGAPGGIGATAVALGATVAVTYDLDEGAYLYELPLVGPASLRARVTRAAGTPTAAPGNVLRLSGVGFGRKPGEVLVNDAPAAVLAWGDRSIRVTVPAGEHAAAVRVRTADGRAADASFSYAAPTVTRVVGAVVRPGGLVTLKGSGFGAPGAGASSWVECGGDVIPAGSPAVKSWSDGSVTVQAPATPGTVLVRIRTAAGESAPVEVTIQPAQ